jgi:hypothetical protein
MFFGRGAKVVENYSGLDAGEAAGGIDFENAGHVFGEIEDDGDIAALTGEGGAGAAAEEWGSVLAAKGHGGDDIVGISGKNDADGDLAVVGAVGGVEGAGAGIEADVAAEVGAEGIGEGVSVEVVGHVWPYLSG